MNKLYNKIYKAINEGIQKALLIDPEQNDVSINYSYHKIDNSFNIFGEYIKKLKETSEPEDLRFYYQELIKISKSCNQLYKVNNFTELYTIYQKIKSIKGISNNMNLSWIDMSSTFVYLDDDKEIPLHLLNRDNVSDVDFIKIHLTDTDEIIFHKTLNMSDDDVYTRRVWCHSIKQYDWMPYLNKYKTSSRYNGYDRTQDIIKILNAGAQDKYSAFAYIQELNDKFSFYDYTAYIPTYQELSFIFQYEDFINFILAKLKCNQYQPKHVSIKKTNCMWTSEMSYVTSSGACDIVYLTVAKSSWHGHSEYSPTYAYGEPLCLNDVFPFFHKNN